MNHSVLSVDAVAAPDGSQLKGLLASLILLFGLILPVQIVELHVFVLVFTIVVLVVLLTSVVATLVALNGIRDHLELSIAVHVLNLL